MSAINKEIEAIWPDETHLNALTEFRDICGEDWDDYVNFEPDEAGDFEVSGFEAFLLTL